ANQMTSKERHDLEKSLLEEEFENEAFEGLSQLTSYEISSDLKTLNSELASKTRKGNSYQYWRIAASLLLLGMFSFIVYFLIDTGTTRDIAQTKELPSVEETDGNQHSRMTYSDTSIIESDRIVAYQQDLSETKRSSPKVEQEPSPQMPVMEEPLPDALSEIEDVEEELEGISIDMDVAEPVDLPMLAMVQEEQIEIESTKQKKEIVSEKALAPAAVMRKSAAANQSRMVAGKENVRTVTGKVMSQEDDEAIPGVNIIVKGTGTGTVTDSEGNYSIDIPADDEVTLVYSSVGYTSEEIEAKYNETIDVNIEPDITALSEIVVTGYGTEKKQNMTGAVSTVDMDKSENKGYRYTPPEPTGGHGDFKE
ncbi:MAG: carboxypeptidase-like regulatory domain-containing protein, partial [Cyclobacteriaceae bacterium]|nr:carboxypeptidase-like regulatory domain-containing protein [Cyclobacteriaceae bacterium]